MNKDDRSHTVTALTTTNILLSILAIGFAVAFGYAEFIYDPELDPQTTARYAEVAKARLAERSDEILAEAASLASETAPPLGEALYDQAQEDYKLYLATLEREGDVFVENAQQMLIRQAQAQYGEYLRAHRDVLKEEFPQHASDENVEKVLAEFEQTLNRLIERYYLDEFAKEAERTRLAWKRIEPVELPGPNEPSLEEQLADYAADWTILTLADAPPAEAPAATQPDTARNTDT